MSNEPIMNAEVVDSEEAAPREARKPSGAIALAMRLLGWVPIIALIVGGVLGVGAILAGTFPLLPIVPGDTSVAMQFVYLGGLLAACPVLSILMIVSNMLLSISGGLVRNIIACVLGFVVSGGVLVVGGVLQVAEVTSLGELSIADAGLPDPNRPFDGTPEEAALRRELASRRLPWAEQYENDGAMPDLPKPAPFDSALQTKDNRWRLTSEKTADRSAPLASAGIKIAGAKVADKPLDIVKVSHGEDVAAIPLTGVVPPAPIDEYEPLRPAWHSMLPLWDFGSADPIKTLAKDWTPCAAFPDNGDTLAIVDKDHVLHRFDLIECRRTHEMQLPRAPIAMQMHGDDLLVALGDPPALLWIDPDTLDVAQSMELPRKTTLFTAPTEEGDIAFAAGGDRFHVLDLNKREIKHQIVVPAGYRDDYPEQERSLAGMAAMGVSPNGEYLYTFNHRIHRLKADAGELYFEESSPPIYAAQWGRRPPFRISQDGSMLAIEDFDKSVRENRLYNFKGILAEIMIRIYDADDLSKPKRERGAGSPLTSISFSHDGASAFRVSPCGTWSATFTEPVEMNRRGERLFAIEEMHHDDKPWYEPQAVFCLPDRRGAVLFEHDGATLYEGDWKAVRDRLAKRPEGSSYRSPEETFADAMEEAVSDGGRRLDTEGVPLVASKRLVPVVRYLGLPDYPFHTQTYEVSPDRERLYLMRPRAGQFSTLAAFTPRGEKLGEYEVSRDIPTKFEKSYVGDVLARLRAAQMDEDPADEFLLDSRGPEHIVKSVEAGDGKLTLERSLAVPEKGPYSREPFIGDFDGDGIDEFVVEATRSDGADSNDYPAFARIDPENVDDVSLLEDAKILDPIPLIGDTNGDGRENLLVAGWERTSPAGFFIRISHLHQWEQTVCEAEEYDVASGRAARRVEFPTHVTRDSLGLAWSRDLEKSVFVGLTLNRGRFSREMSRRPRLPGVPWTDVDGPMPVWGFDKTIDWTLVAFDADGGELWSRTFDRPPYAPTVNASSDSPYVILSWPHMHETEVIDAASGKTVARVVGYAADGATKCDFMKSPDGEEFLLVARENAIDVFQIVAPDSEQASAELDASAFKIVDFRPVREERNDVIAIEDYLAGHFLQGTRFLKNGRLVPPEEMAEQAGIAFPLRDDFDGQTTIDWKVMRRDDDHMSMEKKPGCLTIEPRQGVPGAWPTLDGDRSPANMHLIEPPPVDEAFTAELVVNRFEPTNELEQVGIVFFDEKDFLFGGLKLSERRGDEPFVAMFGRRKGKMSYPAATDYQADGEPVTIRIAKNGAGYRLLYRIGDGKTTQAGETNWGDGTPKYVGFFAVAGPNGDSKQEVELESFSLAAMQEAKLLPLSEPCPPYVQSGIGGRWRKESAFCRGAGVMNPKASNPVFTISGNGRFYFWGEMHDGMHGELTPSHVDESTGEILPVRIEFTPHDDPNSAVDGGTIRAIAHGQGSVLTICFNLDPDGDFPTSFVTSPKENTLKVRFRRIE